MNDKKILFSSFAWKFSERMLSQGIGLIIQIFIARMIKPEAVGEMAIILSVINIFSVIAQSGFSSYIIQKQDLKEEDISSVAAFSIIISIICIIIFFLFGNAFMSILGYPQLGIYLKVSGIMLLFNAINGICVGLLSKEMQFKEMFMRTLVVLPISAAVCFAFMFYGFDLMALIAYNIANPCCTTIFMLGLLYKRGSKFRISIKRRALKLALPYSFRVLTQDIGNVACNSIRNFLMGMIHSTNALAYYDRAFTYTSYIEESVTYTASSVLLPALAKEQDNKTVFNNYIINATAIYSIIIVPALLGFAAMSPTFTKTILTEKWLPCVPYICVFAVGFLHYPILTIHRPAFLACGRSDITLKITIIQNIASLLMLAITVKHSPLWISIGTSAALLIYIPLYVYATKRYMGIALGKQTGPMVRYIVYSIIMACAVYPVNSLGFSGLIIMLLQILIGITVYTLLLVVTKDKLFFYIVCMIKNRIRRS